jgi:hypothetical protein
VKFAGEVGRVGVGDAAAGQFVANCQDPDFHSEPGFQKI